MSLDTEIAILRIAKHQGEIADALAAPRRPNFIKVETKIGSAWINAAHIIAITPNVSTPAGCVITLNRGYFDTTTTADEVLDLIAGTETGDDSGK